MQDGVAGNVLKKEYINTIKFLILRIERNDNQKYE